MNQGSIKLFDSFGCTGLKWSNDLLLVESWCGLRWFIFMPDVATFAIGTSLY